MARTKHIKILNHRNMREKQEDFKWFGEGFEGFPKHLPDDCVEYTLHIIDPRLDEATRRTRLRQVQQAANTLTKELLKDFIWQRQKFNLELIQSNGKVTNGFYSI